jgi:hypothetical protein
MVTDENLEEIIKEERKKIFWRLNMIPWILLTLTLLAIILIVYKQSINNKPILETIGGSNSLTRSTRSIQFMPEMNIVSQGIEEIKIENEAVKRFYSEAVKNGYGEWKCNAEGLVTFHWKPCTESVINSQVEQRVKVEVNSLRENYKKNAIVVLEGDRKKTSTECRREFCIEAVSNGVARWVAKNDGLTEFKWKTLPEIVLDYTSTESSKLIEKGMIKREMPFTESNYELAKKVGIDIEGELVKRVGISLEGAFWGEEIDAKVKGKIRVEVNKAIHGIFDGFEALNKTDKKWGIK